VLLAMGLGMPDAVGGLRLTLSPENTVDEIDELLRVLPDAVHHLRPIAAAR
jgi:cysteine sulfinate desulfinase/cysteine desulfurase-like protein